MNKADGICYDRSESRGQAHIWGLEYASDVDDLHGDYDRRDYLSQPQTSFTLLVNVNRQSYTKTKWLLQEIEVA